MPWDRRTVSLNAVPTEKKRGKTACYMLITLPSDRGCPRK